MKSGASDPFADDASEERDDVEESTDEESAGEELAVEESAGGEPTDEEVGSAEEAGSVENAEKVEGVEEVAEELAEDAVDDELDGGEIDRDDIPWVLRRDAVKDDRPHVHQLFVREDTDGKARRAESRLEERLGEDVYRLDAREAIYLVGMRHLDEVAALLEEWGYDL